MWTDIKRRSEVKSYIPFIFQMEDDVEVELELEKQLALAHELFPAG